MYNELTDNHARHLKTVYFLPSQDFYRLHWTCKTCSSCGVASCAGWGLFHNPSEYTERWVVALFHSIKLFFLHPLSFLFMNLFFKKNRSSIMFLCFWGYHSNIWNLLNIWWVGEEKVYHIITLFVIINRHFTPILIFF